MTSGFQQKGLVIESCIRVSAVVNQTQSVGDLIGRAARVYRANIATWAPILIGPTIACGIGRALWQASISSIPDFKDAGTILGLTVLALIGFGLALGAKWVLLVRQLAFVRLANGFSDSLEESMDFMKKRQFSLFSLIALIYFLALTVFGLWILEMLASALIYRKDTFLAIPSAIGMLVGVFGSLFTLCFIYFAAFVVLSALACEMERVTALLSTGFRLAGRAPWRTIYAGNLVLLTVYFVSLPFWIPIFVLMGVDCLRVGPDLFTSAQGIPIYWQVIMSAWESLVDMIVWPMAFLAYGYYYYDLRLRQQGVDVMLMLDKLKAETTTG